MDFNNCSAAEVAPTPTPVILARNIHKFFKQKSEMLKGNTNNKDQRSDLDVNTVLTDVDSILEGRSIEDGRLLLRGMVADLLREVDLLRWRLDETSASLQRVKEERDVVNNDYRDSLLSLMLALQNAVGDRDDETIRRERQMLEKGQLLTADEATTLTITTFTKKIERLNLEAAESNQLLAKARESIGELETENASKMSKIAALEKQFRSINKKRHKVVVAKEQQQQQSQLTDKNNENIPIKTPTNARFINTDNGAIQKPVAIPINARFMHTDNAEIQKPVSVPINARFMHTDNAAIQKQASQPINACFMHKPEPNTAPLVERSTNDTNIENLMMKTTVSNHNHSKSLVVDEKNISISGSVTSTVMSSKLPKHKGGHGPRLVKLVDDI